MPFLLPNQNYQNIKCNVILKNVRDGFSAEKKDMEQLEMTII